MSRRRVQYRAVVSVVEANRLVRTMAADACQSARVTSVAWLADRPELARSTVGQLIDTYRAAFFYAHPE